MKTGVLLVQAGSYFVLSAIFFGAGAPRFAVVQALLGTVNLILYSGRAI